MSAQMIRVDYKPAQTLRDRAALKHSKRAADEFWREQQSPTPKPEKSKKWYFWLGWMSGGPFWVLLSAVIFALVLYWTSPSGVAK
jgi:hypothetical protein